MDFSRFDEKFVELHRAMQKQIKEAVDPKAAMEDMNTKINVIMDALGLEIPETKEEETEEVEMETIKQIEDNEPAEEEVTEEKEETTTEEIESVNGTPDTFTVPEGLEETGTFYTVKFNDNFKFTDTYQTLKEKGLDNFRTSSFAELVEYLKYLPLTYKEQEKIITKDALVENGDLLFDMMFTISKEKKEPVTDTVKEETVEEIEE